jgi:hypothetical protein|nr:MAG TPA: Protein of unknown function (DUF1492) [Caudoviricetes sp.]
MDWLRREMPSSLLPESINAEYLGGKTKRRRDSVTNKELSQLYYLNKEIKQLESNLMELETTAYKTTPNLTGIPGSGKCSDKVGRYAAEIADLKALINLNIKKCWHEKRRLERYIQSIDDSLIRQIFFLRYIELKKWEDVAASLGGNNTENSVKQIHSRYLRSH